MAAGNIQVGNRMLIDPVIPYQSIIANPENRAIANGLYPVHRWFKWDLSKVSVAFVFLPAVKIDLTLGGKQNGFYRHQNKIHIVALPAGFEQRVP